jgi:hypothetical protein
VDHPHEVEVKAGWLLAFRFWWAFTWRLFAFNAVIALVYTLAFKLFGGKHDLLDAVLLIIFSFIFLAIEIWLMRGLLSRRFGRFRLAVLTVKNR